LFAARNGGFDEVSHGGVTVAGSLAQQSWRGGHAWVFLQYLLGFRKLGFDVLFLDRATPDGGITEDAKKYLDSVMNQFELASDYCLLGADGQTVAGIPRHEALSRTRDSILINVTGYLDDREFLAAAQRRVYLDVDPGFAQMWRQLGLYDTFAGHELFVTIGENIGRPGCGIPTCGLDWITTRQPVVLDLWPALNHVGSSFTSVGAWRGPFAPVEYRGVTYGLRVHEFRKFVDLPHTTGEDFELALDIHEAETTDLELLRRTGWRIIPPQAVAGDPISYRDYLGQSRAEFMVAKNMYVETQGGWFSDRSACYLASGKPVLAQDTGIASLYSIGEGLLTFSTFDEAAGGVEAIMRDYTRHSRAARELAEEFFDSSKVLITLLEKLSA
jgi:hypothetical protein